MELILTHLNSRLPAYVWHNFINLRIWNPDVVIKMICHEQHQTDDDKLFLQHYNIELVPCESIMDDLWKEFLSVSWYHVWGTPNTKYPSPPNFVQGTSERLYALNAYCASRGLSDIVHIENDVMVYESLDVLLPIMQACYKQLALTPMADKDHTFAFVYIPTHDKLTEFCLFNTEQLKLGNDFLVRQYNLEMVHEMSIAKIYKDLHNKIDFFPILPYGPYSEHFDVFHSIFDPASWGQFIGGTNNQFGCGYAGQHHIIGREIIDGKCSAYFNGKYPVTNTGIKINNLHVHSKRLQDFITQC